MVMTTRQIFEGLVFDVIFDVETNATMVVYNSVPAFDFVARNILTTVSATDSFNQISVINARSMLLRRTNSHTSSIFGMRDITFATIKLGA